MSWNKYIEIIYINIEIICLIYIYSSLTFVLKLKTNHLNYNNMETLNYISLDKKGILPVVKELQKLLADIQVFYTNLRGFHWNVTGKQFYMLHEKFEEIYNDMNDKADEVAERILMLGHTPANNYSDYLKISGIKEVSGKSDGKEIIKIILDSFKILINSERSVLEKAAQVNDEVTVAMMSDYLKEQEKTVWMLVATLKD